MTREERNQINEQVKIARDFCLKDSIITKIKNASSIHEARRIKMDAIKN